MIAAALIPMILILGLVALFLAAGAGSLSWFPALAVTALLIGLAAGLGRMLVHMDDPPSAP